MIYNLQYKIIHNKIILKLAKKLLIYKSKKIQKSKYKIKVSENSPHKISIKIKNQIRNKIKKKNFKIKNHRANIIKKIIVKIKIQIKTKKIKMTKNLIYCKI
jgi:hypothetical protein